MLSQTHLAPDVKVGYVMYSWWNVTYYGARVIMLTMLLRLAVLSILSFNRANGCTPRGWLEILQRHNFHKSPLASKPCVRNGLSVCVCECKFAREMPEKPPQLMYEDGFHGSDAFN